ncbi:hypothetical protein T4C_11761 [Trichinella pseudospiralis]|uniref:Uncharacterized protein n=1 Tax=Trichinella pseudospiralis TaxID=6337 RepID=A0A0V1GHM5_TRIPS|nr:hypothetical protein T4C_11761 [Trichinella pseudospiralis]
MNWAFVICIRKRPNIQRTKASIFEVSVERK